MPNLDSQTRELLLVYLNGSVPLNVLRRRFMHLDWALLGGKAAHKNPLTARSSVLLAQYAAGECEETELRELLTVALNSVCVPAP